MRSARKCDALAWENQLLMLIKGIKIHPQYNEGRLPVGSVDPIRSASCASHAVVLNVLRSCLRLSRVTVDLIYGGVVDRQRRDK